MTEVYLQDLLFKEFKKLNSFSGVNFITDKNVSYPNKSFIVPDDKRYFVLNFLSNAPTPIATFSDSQNLYNGFLQIDIYTSLDVGESEIDNKYSWISKLFSRGKEIEDIMIIRTYKANSRALQDSYCCSVRVEWEAVIDKE